MLQQVREATVGALAVHGALTTRQVQLLVLPDVSHRAVRARLVRMSKRGVVQQLSGHWGVPCWAATPAGLEEFEIELPAVRGVGAATARHGHIVSEVVIALQLGGGRVTTERELRRAAVLQRERLGFVTGSDGRKGRIYPGGARVPSTPQGIKDWLGAWTPEHLPDLCVEPSAPDRLRQAVEVELNSKLTHLIDRKLRWYQSQASPYGAVRYCCGSLAVARAVQRAADRTGVTTSLSIRVLPQAILDRAVEA